MNEYDFTMMPTPRGRNRYLFLTVIPPMILVYIIRAIAVSGRIDLDQTALLIIWAVPTLILWYFLMFRRTHTIKVSGDVINDKNVATKANNFIRVTEVKSVEKNIIGELILRNREGKTLVIVEAHMTNIDKFKEYLTANGVILPSRK